MNEAGLFFTEIYNNKNKNKLEINPYQRMMNGYLESNMIEEAFSIIQKVNEMANKIYLVQSMIHYYLNLNNVQKALDVIEYFSANGFFFFNFKGKNITKLKKKKE
jgi:hypothetical protein